MKEELHALSDARLCFLGTCNVEPSGRGKRAK